MERALTSLKSLKIFEAALIDRGLRLFLIFSAQKHAMFRNLSASDDSFPGKEPGMAFERSGALRTDTDDDPAENAMAHEPILRRNRLNEAIAAPGDDP